MDSRSPQELDACSPAIGSDVISAVPMRLHGSYSQNVALLEAQVQAWRAWVDVMAFYLVIRAHSLESSTTPSLPWFYCQTNNKSISCPFKV
jgi:hypothetical protein